MALLFATACWEMWLIVLDHSINMKKWAVCTLMPHCLLYRIACPRFASWHMKSNIKEYWHLHNRPCNNFHLLMNDYQWNVTAVKISATENCLFFTDIVSSLCTIFTAVIQRLSCKLLNSNKSVGKSEWMDSSQHYMGFFLRKEEWGHYVLAWPHI